MFETIFKNELSHFTSDHSLINTLWMEIQSHYNQPGRHYHNLVHLDSLIKELLPVKDQIKDWTTLVFSLAYHDSIYDPLKQDNEERSAHLAYERLSELNLPASQKEKCKQQILATKSHERSEDEDTNYFTDADLAILGCNRNAYINYTKQIRREYSYFPDEIYKEGRKAVLMKFLQMPALFKTNYFRDQYEEKAKINMTEELQSLG